MSDDAINNVAEEVVETVEEEQVDELVENEEILDEEVESIEEGKHEEEEEEHEPKKETVQTPKTKAGVIQAAVEMLKKARKEDAQKMFSKMALGSDEEESVKSADDAVKSVSKVLSICSMKSPSSAIQKKSDFTNFCSALLTGSLH